MILVHGEIYSHKEEVLLIMAANSSQYSIIQIQEFVSKLCDISDLYVHVLL